MAPSLHAVYRQSFSGAFDTGSIYKLPKSSVIFNVLMNLALYMIFTIICYYAAYPPERLCRLVNSVVADSKLGMRLPAVVRRFVTVKKMPKEQVIAACLCGAAKTQALGIPLADAMWTQSDSSTGTLIQIPVLLYCMEQVFVAQFLTILFRWWLHRDKKGQSDEESDGVEGQAEAGGSNNGKEHGAGDGDPVPGRQAQTSNAAEEKSAAKSDG